VRIINPDEATGAVTRVTIEASNGSENWFTVGCSSNIIEASYQSLADSFELYLLRHEKKRKEGVA
jgi:2-isopropylmalate synthase